MATLTVDGVFRQTNSGGIPASEATLTFRYPALEGDQLTFKYSGGFGGTFSYRGFQADLPATTSVAFDGLDEPIALAPGAGTQLDLFQAARVIDSALVLGAPFFTISSLSSEIFGWVAFGGGPPPDGGSRPHELYPDEAAPPASPQT